MNISRKRRQPPSARQDGEPLVAVGPPLFIPRDDLDGAVVARFRLFRAPDGQFVGLRPITDGNRPRPY